MRLAWIVAPVVGVAACLGALAWSAQDDTPSRANTYKQLELFADVLVRVQNDYVTKIDDEKVIQSAIQGMLSGLDPHSSYLTPEDFKDMQTQTRGEYGGLGIEVTSEDGLVKVVSPIDDTPAAKAGIHAGDYLTAIDGESIIGFSLNDAVSRMRGPVGTSITVTVAREGSEPFDVNLTRQIIAVKSVTWKMDKDIGVIRVSAFNEKTGDAFETAIRDMRKQAGGGLRGVVLDLRNNPGGLLDQSIQVADAMLDGGEVVSTRGRRPDQIERYNARRGELLTGVPIVVLINGGSASASEIVAGALQDRGRALIIGTTSFGKGSVQTVIPLKGGREGALRLTTAKYYTPSGRSIQGSGIDPDIEVAATRIDPDKLKRLGIISESDLPGAFKNPDGTVRKGPHVPQDQPPADWNKDADYQMKRAMDYLHQGVVAERLRAKAG
ncbi:MAG TPA: S41 family peptidase [Caulobacterales bacterium]|jgi:carboxyl-terminal processing protease|nr:S41 family peptidase [Caulobacterales bacterium]